MSHLTRVCLTLTLLAAGSVHAQPDSLWSRTYGGDVCHSLVQTAEGGFALAGNRRSFQEGGSEFFLVRTDENGDSLWSRAFGGQNDDVCYSIVQTADSAFALAGMTNSFGVGNSDFWLVRTNGEGDSLWSRTYGGAGEESLHSLIQAAEGGFALAGWTYSFTPGDSDFWLVRTDENGDSLWSHTYGGRREDRCYSAIQTSDGGFALAGSTRSFGAGIRNFWLMRVDENGDSLWSRTFGAGGETCYSVIQIADGGYALAGTTWEYGNGWGDFWIVRTDENGDSLWSRTYGVDNPEECFSLIQCGDGGYALAGITLPLSALNDSWLVITDYVGDSLWSRTYGGKGEEVCNAVAQTKDGGFALAGTTSSFGARGFWLLRLGPENSVPGDGATAPLQFSLDGVYPNPFNSQAVSRYKLQVASWVSLRLYDLKGQLVETIAEGRQAAGSHQAVINGSHLPSGIYPIRLSAGNRYALGKVCLVK